MTHVSLHAFPGDADEVGRLAAALGVDVRYVATHVFDDGEIAPRIAPSPGTVVVYRSLAQPNVKLVELLLACDAWRRAGARRLVLVAPYLCYMRQDALFAPGEPLSQRVIGDLLGERFDRIITVDAHLHRTPRLEDVFVGVVCANLSAADAIAAQVRADAPPPDMLMLGPDIESRPWVETLARQIGLEAGVLRKTRRSDHDVDIETGPELAIEGRPVLLLDDICTSGGTLVAASRAVLARGASSVEAIVTHALFSREVAATLTAAGIRRVRSCDSCRHPTNAIPLAATLAAALREE